jgi:hypothetical protein
VTQQVEGLHSLAPAEAITSLATDLYFVQLHMR